MELFSYKANQKETNGSHLDNQSHLGNEGHEAMKCAGKCFVTIW